MPLHKDLREFVELLNANEVDFLVVGAFALAFHGVSRYTADLDLFVRPTSPNGEKIMKSLLQFGFGGLEIQAVDFQTPNNIIQLGVNPNRIDLLTAIDGVAFEEAWATRAKGDLDGVPVQFIGLNALLRNKESTGRARDVGDVEELRKRLDKQR